MPSVRRAALARLLGTTALLLVTAGLLAGCTTTQHEAQRMQLDSARERVAAEVATKVTSSNPLVSATVSATVSEGRKTAVIVSVHNGSRKAVTDLPISVGYSLSAGTHVYLNSATGLDYFQSHLPAILAGRSQIWVFTAHRSLPKGARVFALVGDKPSVSARVSDPDLQVALKLYKTSAQKLRISLLNSTSVPQYQLQLYAYAKRGGRYVAAANTTVVDLGAGSKQNLTLPLTGAAQGAAVHVEAIPTILQ